MIPCRFEEKNCCLPFGGPGSHPAPPAEKQCPPNGWSWSDEQDCCIPHNPRPRHKPPPHCSKDWDWESASLCCKPHHPSHPKPSGGAGNWKRAPQSPLPQLCPMGLRACPISGTSTLSSDYECLDTTNELEACGGCASTGEGEDCTAIKGAWNVGCERGTCAGKSNSYCTVCRRSEVLR